MARAVLLLVALPVAILVAGMLGVRVNMSTSLAPGLYRVIDAPVAVGRIVRFCPHDVQASEEARNRGYFAPGTCKGNYRPLLKQVAAMAGDHVHFENEGVHINGRRHPGSARASRDPHGRPLPVPPHADVIVGAQEFLPLSDYSTASYDGRYFGLADRAAIIEVVVPLWVIDRHARVDPGIH